MEALSEKIVFLSAYLIISKKSITNYSIRNKHLNNLIINQYSSVLLFLDFYTMRLIWMVDFRIFVEIFLN